MCNPLYFQVYFVAAMFVGALLPKALQATIAFVVGLAIFYPDCDKAGFLVLFYVPAVLLATFRE